MIKREMRIRSRGTWCLLLAALCVTLLAVVRLGLVDRVLPGGALGRGRATYAVLAWSSLAWIATAGVLAWRRHKKALLATLGGALCACLAFDLVARALALPAGIPRVGTMGMSSRTLHHRYPPGQRVRLGPLGGDQMVLHANEDGLRSRYGRADFVARAPRIAILGDSFVFGLGVPEGAEFPVLLEELLRERSAQPSLGVLNAGVVSYSPYLERWQFHDLVRHYRPELVLVVVDVTDIGDDLRYESESSTRSGHPVFDTELEEAESFADHGPLWTLSKPLRQCLRLPFEVAASLSGTSDGAARPTPFRFDLELGGVRETNQYFLYRHPLELTRPYFERTLANLVALAGLVEASGARFAAVVIPRFQHWNPKECPDNWEKASYALDEPYQLEYFRFFEEARARVDFPILDLLPAFQATDEFPLVLRQDPHWNEAGHAFVARTLAGMLLEQGLVPLAGSATR